MKLITLTVALVLLVIPGYKQSDRSQSEQAQKEELLKLEARLKQIDEESDPVKIRVTGDKESSGKIKISVTRESGPARIKDSASRDSSAKEKPQASQETLLDLDLSKINVSDEYIDEKIATIFAASTRCGTLPGVAISQIGVSPYYLVLEDYVYDSGTYRITVPKGFRYDRASIPRIFWVVIDKDSLGNVAPLLHDLLYQHGGALPQNQVSPYRKFSRQDTDDLFLEVATKCGVPKWRRDLAYQAVRNFGQASWQQSQ